MKAIVTTLTVILAACAAQAREYHVSIHGLVGNNGAKARPFKTISAAAAVAQPGDTITVHAGVYRERVNPPRGGTADSERIAYRAAPGEAVTIKGSEVVRTWERVQDGVWKVTLPNGFFGDFNPYADVIGGEWYHTPRDGYDRHTGAVYLNGHWLDESLTLDKVLAPARERTLWKAAVDKDHTTIWAQFKDVDPNRELVEINVRQLIFKPWAMCTPQVPGPASRTVTQGSQQTWILASDSRRHPMAGGSKWSWIQSGHACRNRLW